MKNLLVMIVAAANIVIGSHSSICSASEPKSKSIAEVVNNLVKVTLLQDSENSDLFIIQVKNDSHDVITFYDRGKMPMCDLSIYDANNEKIAWTADGRAKLSTKVHISGIFRALGPKQTFEWKFLLKDFFKLEAGVYSILYKMDLIKGKSDKTGELLRDVVELKAADISIK